APMRCAATMDRVAAADLAAATRSCAPRQHQLGLTANRARHAARRALEALLHPARDELPRAVHCNNCVTCDTGFVATAARASHDDGNAADRCEQDYDIRSKYLIKFKGNNEAWVGEMGACVADSGMTCACSTSGRSRRSRMHERYNSKSRRSAYAISSNSVRRECRFG